MRWPTRERVDGTFTRRLTLGEGIGTGCIPAHHADGGRSVAIPRSERAKPRKVRVTSDEPQDQEGRTLTVEQGAPAAR